MGQNGCLKFWKITANEKRSVCQGIAVVQHRYPVFPQLTLPAFLHPSNALHLPGTHVCLPTDNVIQIRERQCLSNQKHNQYHLELWPTHPCFFWWMRLFPHPVWRLHLAFNIILINPHLISCNDVLKKVFITICIGKQVLTVSTQFSFWSSIKKRGTNFALTQRIWIFQQKFDGKILYWWPLRQQLLVQLNDDFQESQHEISQHGRRLLMCNVVQAWNFHRPTFCLFKTLKPLIALRSAHTVLPVRLNKQLKCLCKMFPKFAAKFHTHTHTRCSSSSLIVTLSLIRRTPCTRAQFSGCSSTTNAYRKTGQMAVCFQYLTLGALSSRSDLSVLIGALFKIFCLILNTPRIYMMKYLGILLRKRHFPKQLLDKLKSKHHVFKNIFAKRCAVWQIMWKKMVKLDRQKNNIIQSMRLWCCLIKQETHSEYVAQNYFLH